MRFQKILNLSQVTYHGQADYIITSDNSPRYYNHVSQTMGLSSSDLDEFYRFFRISGMGEIQNRFNYVSLLTRIGHCGGGVGAHMIGQTGAETTTLEPQNNVLVRIVDWVENGNAPETVTGTKYVNASRRYFDHVDLTDFEAIG
jgi:feruloyl esterase